MILNHSADSRFSTRERFWLFLLGVAALAPLAIAACLQPDPRGHGTHQQLGLPPCTFRLLFGIPCPSCGMTTAWSHVMHGQMRDALQTHVSGTLLAALTATIGAASLILATRGKRPGWWPPERAALAALAGVATMVLAEWGWRRIGD